MSNAATAIAKTRARRDAMLSALNEKPMSVKELQVKFPAIPHSTIKGDLQCFKRAGMAESINQTWRIVSTHPVAQKPKLPPLYDPLYLGGIPKLPKAFNARVIEERHPSSTARHADIWRGQSSLERI